MSTMEGDKKGKSEGLCHRLYVEGEGDVKIHSIELKLFFGGDKFESD